MTTHAGGGEVVTMQVGVGGGGRAADSLTPVMDRH